MVSAEDRGRVGRYGLVPLGRSGKTEVNNQIVIQNTKQNVPIPAYSFVTLRPEEDDQIGTLSADPPSGKGSAGRQGVYALLLLVSASIIGARILTAPVSFSANDQIALGDNPRAGRYRQLFHRVPGGERGRDAPRHRRCFSARLGHRRQGDASDYAAVLLEQADAPADAACR